MDKVNYEVESLMQEIKEARLALQQAIQNENYADSAHLDAAIESVTIAKARLNNLYKKAKVVFSEVS